MPTTTIRIEDDLKERVGAAARRLGKTPHAFMLEAIARTVDEVERDEALRRVVEERWGAFVQDGEAVSADEMARWVRARARGERPARPRARRVLP
jgi:predicted transcriptional regulator